MGNFSKRVVIPTNRNNLDNLDDLDNVDNSDNIKHRRATLDIDLENYIKDTIENNVLNSKCHGLAYFTGKNNLWNRSQKLINSRGYYVKNDWKERVMFILTMILLCYGIYLISCQFRYDAKLNFISNVENDTTYKKEIDDLNNLNNISSVIKFISMALPILFTVQNMFIRSTSHCRD
jgi:hypothetical protein